MTFLWPTEEQLNQLHTNFDDGRAITMLNLLRYREHANYADHPQETPCSGKAAYARYAENALACVAAAGGRLVFGGAAQGIAIGPEDEIWDDVLLVEYPNVQAFIDMANSEEYLAFAYHRTAALSDSRLVPITAGKLSFEN